MQEIDRDSQKFERCIKALNENNVQHRLTLHSVFKIENKELLRKFEIQREQVAEADRPVVLKGLFTHVQKHELMSRLIFGFSDKS